MIQKTSSMILLSKTMILNDYIKLIKHTIIEEKLIINYIEYPYEQII
ncbi:hypothetical protein [Aliarcobacter butzleri]|nr:hypothetical protein [Aliarcobacter butzleri]